MSIVTVPVQDDEPFQGARRRMFLNSVNGFDVLNMGDSVIEPGCGIPPHVHPMDEAFFVFEGSGTVIVGDEERLVSAETAVLARAGVRHGWRNDTNTTIKMVWVYLGRQVEYTQGGPAKS